MPDKTLNRPSAASRREQLRRQQQAAARNEARTRTAIRIAWATGLAVIAVLIGVMVWAFLRPGAAAPTGAQAVPASATDDGAVLLGKPDAPVTVALYADFLCPYCGEFERANGDDLAAAVTAGTVKLEYHPMAFLDDQSAGTRYSSRAANAFVTVLEADPAAALEFQRLLYANQPREGAPGLSDDRLGELAGEAGASATTIASLKAGTYSDWIAAATQKAWASGITGTPTVKVDGQLLNGDPLYTPGTLATVIAEAARD